MTIPKTIEGREYNKFVESPSRGAPFTAIEVTGIRGGDAGNIEQDFADQNIPAVKLIYKTINGVDLANNNATIDQANVLGLTRNSANAGGKIKYQTIGKFEDSSLNFNLNDTLFLGVNGEITSTPPVTGFLKEIGFSLGAGAIQIDIQETIII